MDRRLQKIAEHIEPGKGFIDVGTDHGYIPIEMLLNGYQGNVFASDINAGPLQTARVNAINKGVQNKITFQLCDGLKLCPSEEIDTIVIAGMGGEMICSILDQAEWCMNSRYKLILQPMTKQEILRYWLVNNQFEILTEEVVHSSRLYQVLTARYTGKQMRISDAELYCGKLSVSEKNNLFYEMVSRLIQRFEYILQSESNTAMGYSIQNAICGQLKEIMKEYDNG